MLGNPLGYGTTATTRNEEPKDKRPAAADNGNKDEDEDDEDEDEDDDEDEETSSPSSALAEDDEDEGEDDGSGEFKPSRVATSTSSSASASASRPGRIKSPGKSSAKSSQRKSSSPGLHATTEGKRKARRESSALKWVEPREGSDLDMVEVHGTKVSAQVSCDTDLLEKLLPMGAVQFNQEVKDRDLKAPEVRELRLARKRYKNARAAERSRARTSETATHKEKKIRDLEEKCARMEDYIAGLEAELAKFKGVSPRPAGRPTSTRPPSGKA